MTGLDREGCENIQKTKLTFDIFDFDIKKSAQPVSVRKMDDGGQIKMGVGWVTQKENSATKIV